MEKQTEFFKEIDNKQLIDDLLGKLLDTIEDIENNDRKIEKINYVRECLHEISPLKHHPVDCVLWVKSDDVQGNEYNPNAVAPPEQSLLETSILEDGYTMSIVGYKPSKKEKEDEGFDFNHVIVDGFHRRKSERVNSEISKSTLGYVPMSLIRSDKKGKGNRMASTIRHNRARGTHSIDLMKNIVSELVEAGMGDAWIMKHVGMDKDEILRLKQLTGLQQLFKDNEYSKSWD